MLLTVSTTHRPATDLGYLLVKHPDKVHAFDVPTGTAYVMYPEAGEESSAPPCAAPPRTVPSWLASASRWRSAYPCSAAPRA